MAGKRLKFRKGYCIDGQKCPSACPVPSVDNNGQKYPGCTRFRLKSQAEVDAMCRPVDLDRLAGIERAARAVQAALKANCGHVPIEIEADLDEALI
jgi:hypothetical protein